MSDIANPVAIFCDGVDDVEWDYTLIEKQLSIDLKKRSKGTVKSVLIPLANVSTEWRIFKRKKNFFTFGLPGILFALVFTILGLRNLILSNYAQFFVSIAMGGFFIGWPLRRWFVWHWIICKHVEVVRFLKIDNSVAFDIIKNRRGKEEFDDFLRLLIEQIKLAKESG